MVYTLHFFSSKFSLFHNSNVFGSCVIHILYTGCAKIKKNNSGAKRLKCHDNKSGGNRDISCGRIDEQQNKHVEANIRFS